MRINRIFLLSLLLPLLLVGCRKNGFKIEFALNEDVWGNYQLTYYASDGHQGKWLSTTAPLQNGKFILTGITRRPTLVYITGVNQYTLPVYVEPGQTIHISGSQGEPQTWTITGNEIDKEWSEWRLKVSENPKADMAQEIASYVKQNPDSPLSALMLITGYPRNEEPGEFVKLWNQLGSKSLKVEFANLASSPDLSGDGPFSMNSEGRIRYDGSRRMLKSLAFRTAGGYGDTLRWNPGPPALLYFYRRGIQQKTEIADTLRALRKAFPDSVKAPIATISMDPDSVNWKSAVVQDSIPKAMAAWMPLGVTDKRAMMFGVGRAPFFMVVGSNGKQLYRGNDYAKAASVYRRALSGKK